MPKMYLQLPEENQQHSSTKLWIKIVLTLF